jgi:hypothetical protein
MSASLLYPFLFRSDTPLPSCFRARIFAHLEAWSTVALGQRSRNGVTHKSGFCSGTRMSLGTARNGGPAIALADAVLEGGASSSAAGSNSVTRGSCCPNCSANPWRRRHRGELASSALLNGGEDTLQRRDVHRPSQALRLPSRSESLKLEVCRHRLRAPRNSPLPSGVAPSASNRCDSD